MSVRTKPRVTKTARVLVEKAIRAMRRYPKTVNMREWIQHDERVKGTDPYCGTEACIAGHIALAAGVPHELFFRPEDVEPKYRKYVSAPPFGSCSPSEFVEKLFGIKEGDNLRVSDAASKLFYKEQWPKKFRVPYNANRRNHAARAKVTIARLRHWLRTGE
jgi:hypothetical protein